MPSVTVLWNPAAGDDRSGREAELGQLFAAEGWRTTIHVLRKEDDAADLARGAVARQSIVAAAGGDGTVSRVAAGVIDAEGTLGILPLGTLNHFAKDLHIPLELEAAVKTIAAGRVGRVDAGRVNDRLFVNNCSIGLYPDIVDLRDRLRQQGHRKWTAMALATARVLRRHRGVRVKIDIGGREHVWRTPFVFIGNNQYTIDGISLGSRIALDRGRLFAYVAPRLRTRELPMLVLKAVAGRRRPGEFEIVSAVDLRIDTFRARRVRLALDGEVADMAAPLHCRTCPAALKIVLPRL